MNILLVNRGLCTVSIFCEYFMGNFVRIGHFFFVCWRILNYNFFLSIIGDTQEVSKRESISGDFF